QTIYNTSLSPRDQPITHKTTPLIIPSITHNRHTMTKTASNLRVFTDVDRRLGYRHTAKIEHVSTYRRATAKHDAQIADRVFVSNQNVLIGSGDVTARLENKIVGSRNKAR